MQLLRINLLTFDVEHLLLALLEQEGGLAKSTLDEAQGEALTERLRNERDFNARLSQMKFKHQASVRIKCPAIGVDVGDSDYASKPVDKCRKAGPLVTDEDETLTMFPALNIEQEAAKEGLDILEDCLRSGDL